MRNSKTIWFGASMGTLAFGFLLFVVLPKDSKTPGTTKAPADAAFQGHNQTSSVFDALDLGLSVQPPQHEGRTRDRSEEPDILDPVASGEPMDANGRRFGPEALALFARVRERYPNNTMIPRVRTPEEVHQQREQLQRNRVLEEKISQGTAKEAEIREFYAFRVRRLQDNLEILEFSREIGKISPEGYSKMRSLGLARIQFYQKEEHTALNKRAR